MKFLKQSTYIRYVINKAIEISPNQHAGLLRFLFTEDTLKIEKGLELVSRPHFSENFMTKFYLVMLHKLARFHYQAVLASQVIQ